MRTIERLIRRALEDLLAAKSLAERDHQSIAAQIDSITDVVTNAADYAKKEKI